MAKFENEVLNYPAGLADIEALTGAAVPLETMRMVPQLFVMGELDDNDSLEFNDGWDRDAANQVNKLFGDNPVKRWAAAEQLYLQAGMQAEFLLIPGIGHDRRQLQTYTTEFFRGVLEQERQAY